jgi:SAM-dependent methyltransferase
VKKDVDQQYTEKRGEEIRVYESVTDVHELPRIFHYWSNKHLRPKLEQLGFNGPDDFFVQNIAAVAGPKPRPTCQILSLGAGNCDTEVKLARLLIERGIETFAFHCLDLNPHMLQRGAASARQAGLEAHFAFIETDINRWAADSTYDVIIANQSLHHFVELEQLIDKTYRSLDDNGLFLTNDMIGRNGHMRWPEALELVHACWSLLEDRHKWHHQLNRFEAVYENWDCSVSGFEGIRAQDILPLLVQTFAFDCFIASGNIINVFVDRAFGHNFDVSNPRDCYFIDFVAGFDDYFIESGKIKPTQMLAAMRKTEKTSPKIYKHLTPAYCIRSPDNGLRQPDPSRAESWSAGTP